MPNGKRKSDVLRHKMSENGHQSHASLATISKGYIIVRNKYDKRDPMKDKNESSQLVTFGFNHN